MEETEQVMGYIPKLLLTEAGEGLFSTAFQHCDGTLEQRPAISPAKDLIAAAEIDYRPYRREVKRLRDEHPLFAPRLEIPMADSEDFVEDGALKICNQLRDRMYARLLRWQDAAPGERANLIPMEYDQYDAWSENARLARMEYLKGKLTAEEFLRRIDTTHELDSYEADKAEQIGQTVWQQRVAGDISFDPKLRYPETIQCLDFDLGTVEPKWEIYTADDLRRQEQRGHQSLRERYQKEY